MLSRGYNIYRQYRIKGDPSPEICDEFVSKILAHFEEKEGKKPTMLSVPIDYTGAETIKGIEIIKDGKPRGNYYVSSG
jgi:hypothetical protein